MQRIQLPVLSRFIAALVVSTCLGSGTTAALAVDDGQTHAHVLKGNVSSNEVIDLLERVGMKCIIKLGNPITLGVNEVHLGSPAFYGGIESGDVLKRVQNNGNTLQVTIGRGANTYQVSIHVPSDAVLTAGAETDLLKGLIPSKDTRSGTKLTARTDKTALQGSANDQSVNLNNQQARKDVAALPMPVLDVTQPNFPQKKTDERPLTERTVTEKEKEEKLKHFDLELIIDISGSFQEIDGTGDISKFEWCHRQVRDLSLKMNKFGKTITITTFNQEFNVMPQCNPSKVEQIYADTIPKGWTDLVDPLMNRLEANLYNHSAAHPLLIAVITDGLPNRPVNPHVVDEALVEYSRKLQSPDQVIVTFLQIGDTFDGKDFCKNLDDNLVNEGAKYDFVDTKTFDELKREGLLNALIDAIVEESKYSGMTALQKHRAKFVNGLPPSASAAEQDAHIKELQDERKEIERMLLEKGKDEKDAPAAPTKQ